MEHYDDQNRLHCYEENSQGPCEDREIFIQPDEEDENGVLKDPVCSTDFEIKGGVIFQSHCPKGTRYDRMTRKCKKTRTHHRNKPCGRHKNLQECLRGLHRRPGSLKTRINGCSNPRGCR